MIKKSIFVLLTFLAFQRLEALPVGNPANATLFWTAETPHSCPPGIPEHMRFSLGYYGDFVFNRHLEIASGKNIDFSHVFTNAAYLSSTFWDVFEIFSTVGMTKISFNTRAASFSPDDTGPRLDVETETSFSWSVGAHATLFEYRCFVLGLMGQYFTSKPKLERIFFRTNANAYPGEESRKRYSEWQVGGGLSYHYNEFFIPYIAIKWCRALWEFNNQIIGMRGGGPLTFPTIKSAKNFGVAIGLTFAPFECKNLPVTVEGRFSDETALYVNASFLF